MPLAKRELVAALSAGMGLTTLLELLPKRNVLLILNYHRIGNAEEAPYDPGTYSATAAEFDRQVTYLRRRFHMTTVDESLAILQAKKCHETRVLITFDDGCLDNYTLAYPILRSHGVQGVFFLPTSFIGTSHIPWWDVIAYVIKHSRKSVIRLEYPEPFTIDLEREGLRQTIMKVLLLYKRPSMQDHERFLSDLETACDTCRPGANVDRAFLSWEEAREMQRGGMAFGSHTHTHEILGRLPLDRQRFEIGESRKIIEAELGGRIEIFAYPRGKPETFTDETIEALKEFGYRAAFSFYGGINRPGKIRPFDILRCGVDGQSHARLRLQTALGTLTGSRWV